MEPQILEYCRSVRVLEA